jgi:hypothetical protein
MKAIPLLSICAVLLLPPPAARAGEADKWTLDVSLYGLAARMSGNVGIGPVNADLNVGFDKILDNLEFGAMGKVRVGYGPWALTTDVIQYDMLIQGPQIGFTFHF